MVASFVSASDLEANRCRQINYERTYQAQVDPWGYSSYADRIRFQRIVETARRWSPHPSRSLDVACGMGQLTAALSRFSSEIMLATGRVKHAQRRRFEDHFSSIGGTVVDRLLFHDRYWYKARSVVRRMLPNEIATSLLARGWFFHAMASLGQISGPRGSIHYGVVIRF